MSEENIRILEMVAQGKITPEEGARLLKALAPDREGEGETGSGARWLVIRVMDLDSDQVHANVRLPLSLAGKLMKFVSRFSGDIDIDIEDIYLAIKSGEPGKALEVITDDGQRVEIWLEA